jgi:hypothetical protein
MDYPEAAMKIWQREHRLETASGSLRLLVLSFVLLTHLGYNQAEGKMSIQRGQRT